VANSKKLSQASVTSANRESLVIYQVYIRSFRDASGDGIGDLRGLIGQLDHLCWLGVDGLWLSPIFKSPQADLGYDVSDYEDIDPLFGSVADVDLLLTEAHKRNLIVLLDIVLCHTSIEHRWFLERKDWYVRYHGEVPPNNWISAFGGSAWSRDGLADCWYLHNFYPEQPQLDWRNPDVYAAMLAVLRFWLDRGVDGFRLDAVQYLFVDALLRDEPPSRYPRQTGTVHRDYAALDHVYTMDLPEVFPALARLRGDLPDALLIAEVWKEVQDLAPYADAVGLVFCFSLLFTAPTAQDVGAVLAASARSAGLAWALSNHDFSRLATRWGREFVRLAATLLLTLPGAAFIYQGDEIGMADGPGASKPVDRLGRDAFRHPIQWTPSGGFSSHDPWLSMIGRDGEDVQSQRDDPQSLLWLYRRLIHLRAELHGPLEEVHVADEMLSYRRGRHLIALNFGNAPCALPPPLGRAEVLLCTSSHPEPGFLPAHSAMIGIQSLA
jgi:alpha-glucosidase